MKYVIPERQVCLIGEFLIINFITKEIAVKLRINSSEYKPNYRPELLVHRFPNAIWPADTLDCFWKTS
jgi:hypothetical protein